MGEHSSARPSRAREKAVAAEGGPWISHNDLLLHSAHADRLIASGLDSLDAIFALQNDRQLSKPGLDSWRERIRFELGPTAEQGVVFIKRFLLPPGSAHRHVQRARCGARSQAGLEWHWLCEFARLGIAAAAPLALGEELVRGREVRSAVITAAVPGKSLEFWCKQDGWPDRAMLKRLLPRLAELAARMHNAGLVHRDFYFGHLFLDSGDDGFQPNGPHLSIIDLQRVMRPTFLPSRWWVKDLAQLNYSAPPRITRADRVRFLHLYCANRSRLDCLSYGQAGSTGLAVRPLYHRIVGKTAQIAAHDRARNQKLLQSGEPVRSSV